MNNLQTIFGAGGAIGIPLAKELKKYTSNIRLVSRNPKKVNEEDELLPIKNLSEEEVFRAIEGSHIVYVTIGLEYKTKVWQTEWPKLMQHIIDACLKNNSKLVFFDNVYLYTPNAVPFMTEDSKIAPSSNKGKVRKEIHDMIFQAIRNNKLQALIARAADFYGPDNKNSMLSEMVVKPFLKKKKAQVFGNIKMIHTFTYTPDAGKATALLGNTDDAYNQVWHLPTTKEKLTTKKWVELIANEMQVEPRMQPVPLWMIKMLGWFMPIMKEFPEMMYQYEQDYILDSSKFEKRFGIYATSPVEGVKEMLKSN